MRSVVRVSLLTLHFLTSYLRLLTFSLAARPWSGAGEIEMHSNSNIISRRVHLLKIDVERAELEVLAGVEVTHWPLIQQVTQGLGHNDGQ